MEQYYTSLSGYQPLVIRRKITTYAGIVNNVLTTGDRKKVDRKGNTIWIEFYY